MFKTIIIPAIKAATMKEKNQELKIQKDRNEKEQSLRNKQKSEETSYENCLNQFNNKLMSNIENVITIECGNKLTNEYNSNFESLLKKAGYKKIRVYDENVQQCNDYCCFDLPCTLIEAEIPDK